MTKPQRRTLQKRPSAATAPLLQAAVIGILLVALGLVCFHVKTSVRDPDLWLHLKAGDWIAHHHAVPFADSFSRIAKGRSWLAYSWLPELSLYAAYRALGVVGIGYYGTLLTLGVACAVLWMAWRLSGRFLASCVLAALACWAFLFNSMPRPVFLSMIFFSITLAILLLADRSGRVQLLYWLPLVFLLWSNSHVQFIYGLGVLGLFLAVTAGERVALRFGLLPSLCEPSKLPIGRVAAVLVACFVATLIGPYTFHLYTKVYDYSKAKVIYSLVLELQALSFRYPRNFVQLALTAAAFVAVGWNKKVDLFKLALLTVCTVIAYRAIRDSWFVTLATVACIADSWVKQSEAEERKPAPRIALGLAAALVCLMGLAPTFGFDRTGLTATVASAFPVQAADFVRQQQLPGPIYNAFGWGGFLIWYLPEYPVVIDGRTDLYGDDMVELFTKTAWAVSYAQDPYLNDARVILVERSIPLVKFLSEDPRYELLYKDKIAAVFRRR